MVEYPLHLACIKGDYSNVVKLVQNDEKLVTVKDLDGRFPIHWAISFQHEDIVEELLKHMKEIDLNSLLDGSNWSPLHIASAVGNISIFQMLMKHPIALLVDEPTEQGTTSLHLACSKNHIKIVEELIKIGASLVKKDKKGQIPLHRACAIGSATLVKTLCDNKSPIDTKDNSGWPPLFHALSEGHGDIAVILVQKYDSQWKDVVSETGETVFHAAVDKKVLNYFLKSVN